MPHTPGLHRLQLIGRILLIIHGHRLQLLIRTIFLLLLLQPFLLHNNNSTAIKRLQQWKFLQHLIPEYNILLFPLKKWIYWIFKS